jgi:hypothetical protein
MLGVRGVLPVLFMCFEGVVPDKLQGQLYCYRYFCSDSDNSFGIVTRQRAGRMRTMQFESQHGKEIFP